MERWDIFCKVVDNYGDIGVCWRLAQQLTAEHAANVRLWVDQLPPFSRLCPAVSATADQQHIGPIEIRHWPTDFPAAQVADVVIESFGCDLPESYIAAMIERSVPPVWINLEYLSAEEWVEGCHRLPSPRTRGPLDKYFFFPGFTPRTGGLLREHELLAQRAAFDPVAEAEFWRGLGVPDRGDDELRMSMFCYQNSALPELLECWAAGSRPMTMLTAPGPATDHAADWLGEPLVIGTPRRRLSLTIHSLPFLPQSQFDRLLWACDVNFVRGEDSFVRSQWAQRPFVWQPYPQSEESHLVKLEAFLDRYLYGFEESTVVRRFWHAWNTTAEPGQAAMATVWHDFIAQRQAIERHGKAWAVTLDQMSDLADNLVCFARSIGTI